jgi:hypothetical protein
VHRRQSRGQYEPSILETLVVSQPTLKSKIPSFLHHHARAAPYKSSFFQQRAWRNILEYWNKK